MVITISEEDLHIYLQPTQFIDSDSPGVMEFTRSVIDPVETDIERGVKLYYVVRDLVRYSPYGIGFSPERYKASWVLREKIGFCIQ
ncbi:MAG: transglutaminase domain-containing protein, partial [Candidatus Aminicenantes bacterium]